MSKFDACLTSLNLRDSVPVDALRTTAAEYQAEGLNASDAMLRAVEDQLELAQMEEATIIATVRSEYEKAGGKKKPEQKAKAQAAKAAEPKPGAVDNTPAPNSETAVKQPAEPKQAPVEEAPAPKTEPEAKPEPEPESAENLRANVGRTIEVDGVRRPITNSKGQLVAEDFAGQQAFWKWFGSSAVVNEQGQPLVAYHGTDADIAEFHGKMIWTTSDPGLANQFVEGGRDNFMKRSKKGSVYPLYASITKPLDLRGLDPIEVISLRDLLGRANIPTSDALFEKMARQKVVNGITHRLATGEDPVAFYVEHYKGSRRIYRWMDDEVVLQVLSEHGIDGILQTETYRASSKSKLITADTFAVFRPEQIKSATGNAGTFSPDTADITAATSTATSHMDSTVAGLVKEGAKVGTVLERIAKDSANADFRALAAALQGQNLKTTLLFERAKGTYTAGVNASMATAAYKASTDTAYLHQAEGAEQNVLHELSHAATLKALDKGGLAAQQIKSLWRHVKALPNFASEYGITNEEEFVAEAFTSPRFRQMLADTPAPGTKLSFWDKLVGIVKMLLGKPPIADSVLARVMAAGPELMAENNAAQDSTAQDTMPLAASTASDLHASVAGALSGAANDIASVRLPANYLVGDLFNQAGKLSWWHKTIGTMDNLSRRQPTFRRVYDAVQSFIGDVSRYGTIAADQAPTLLPKLENVADILGAKRKKAVSAQDTKAFGRPVWEGTLLWARDANGKPVKVAELEAQAEALTTKQKADILIQKGVIDDQQNQAWLGSPLGFYDSVISKKYAESQLRAGVVWSDTEMRTMFNLNDHQISLYKEFRSGVNKSLTNLAISEMVKMGGKYTKGMMAQVAAAPDVRAASELLRDHFRALAQENPEQVDMHLDTAKQVMDVADKAQGLMDAGYAPLSRYGKYTVYVEEGGEQVYFGMFETQAEASRMARKMKADNPQASVIHGTMSEEAYKLFAGVSPETIELFGSAIGMDQTDPQGQEVYQAYLKLAKNNRSAMKRMIHRKGIAGFSEDAGRVLAGFIYSNARLTSANAHLGEVDEAVEAIPKQQGELKDAAVQLREHIRNPAPGTALGGLMFAQFLGGSVASAMVNLTQPFTMTFPFLSQYGGAVKAGQRMGEAMKLATKKETGDAQLDAALKWAAEEGIVAPQEIHYLQSQAAGKGSLMAGDGTKTGDTRAALNNTMAKVTLGWGKLFALAELSNRRITFIAAYKTAVSEGIANPDQFAQEAVSQTQGTYNQGNKPKWARNPIGGLLLTFKQFSIAYIELLSRMAFAGAPGSKERAAGQKAALLMVAVLFVMGGADGLPFEKDLEDLLDGILQRLGYNFSTARAKQAFLTDVLGEGGADFALKGVSSLPGMPIDVSGRFGMGNLIPGTGLLTKKDSYARDLGEFAGPAGDLAKRAFVGTGKALGGDLAGAALEMSPVAVRNLAKGVDMANTGSYNDARGYKVNDTTMTEAAMKAIGFQPNSTADIQDQKGQALNMISQNRIRSQEIAEHWAQGMAQNDPAMIQQARDMRNDWNEKNPEAPIRVSMPGVLKRVRAMKQDAVNRTQKTAPKALKAAVKAELSNTRE